jgi:hypothetical protein
MRGDDDRDDSPAQRVAARLKVTTAQLPSLPDALIAAAVSDLALPLEDQAAVALWLLKERATSADISSTLVAQFERQDKRAREPWRTTLEACEAERTAIKKQPISELQAEYLELAKVGQLTPEDALIVGYLLHGTAEQRAFFGGLVMRKQGLARVVAHNYAVAAGREEAFVQIYGAALEHFPYPLYPAQGAPFAALNTRVLSAAASPNGGGATHLFRPTEVEGGGTLPVVHDGTAWVVDITVVEDAFNSLFNDLNRLGNDIKALKDAPATMTELVTAIKRATGATRQSVREITGHTSHGAALDAAAAGPGRAA